MVRSPDRRLDRLPGRRRAWIVTEARQTSANMSSTDDTREPTSTRAGEQAAPEIVEEQGSPHNREVQGDGPGGAQQGGALRGGDGPARPEDSFANYAFNSLSVEEIAGIMRAVPRLDDETIDAVLETADWRLGSARVVHGQEKEGPSYNLSEDVVLAQGEFDTVITKDQIAPRTLGVHVMTKPGEKEAMVAKRRAGHHASLLKVTGASMGRGNHTSLSSAGLNILRMMMQVPLRWLDLGQPVKLVELTPRRWIDGIYSEQVLHTWASGGGWRSHSRFPIEMQTKRGPWVQDPLALVCWACSWTMSSMGSQGQPACPVIFTGESHIDSLLSVENGEIPEIVVPLEDVTIPAPLLVDLIQLHEQAKADLREQKRALRRLQHTDPKPPKEEYEKLDDQVASVEEELERLGEGDAAAVSVRRRHIQDAVEEVVRSKLVEIVTLDENDKPVTSSGSMSVSMRTQIVEPTVDGAASVVLKISVCYRFKTAALVWTGGALRCRELELFTPERRAEWRSGRNDGLQPSTLVTAERALAALQAIIVTEGKEVLVPLPELTCAATWRHFCHQFRGLGAEVAAVSAASELMVLGPTVETEVAPSESDLQWASGCVPYSDGSTPDDRLLSGTGLMPRRFHTARSEWRSHTVSPAVVYLAENGCLTRGVETVPLYEKTSPGGIRRAICIFATVKAMVFDMKFGTNPSGSIGDLHAMAGVGYLGDALLGRGSQDAQVDNFERQMSRGFNSRHSSGCGLSTDLVSRIKKSTALGSSWTKALRHATGAGHSIERIPPYMYPIVFGDNFDYLQVGNPPSLAPTSLVDDSTPRADWLKFGNAHTTEARHLLITAPGEGLEDRANPPYDVWTTDGLVICGLKDGCANPCALAMDAALVGMDKFADVALFNRTMGTVPTISPRTDTTLRLIVDAPVIKTVAGAHCLVKTCVPRAVRKYEASSVAVPTQFMGALQGIFR